MATKLGWRDGGKTSEEGALRALSKLLSGSGVLDTDDVKVIAATPDDATVRVTIGDIFIGRVAPSASDYYYHGWVATQETINIAANISGSARIDAIVAYIDLTVQDTDNNDNPSALTIIVVEGTPSGLPTVPDNTTIQAAVGEGNPFVKLAEVDVSNGFSSIVDGDITDTRDTIQINGGLPDDSVTTTKILDDAVTADKLADNAVDADNLNADLLTGWNKAYETWNWGSWDQIGGSAGQNATNFGTFTIAGDKTTKYYPGTRIDFVQGGLSKKAIVVKAEYSAPNTTVSIFFGTEYTFASSAITLPRYSYMKCPAGFSQNPDHWKVELKSTTERNENPGTANQWYPGENIDIPLGLWDLYYKARGGMTAAGTHGRIAATISTANNTESDVDLTSSIGTYVYNNTQTFGGGTLSARKTVNLAARDILYLNWKAVGQSLSSAGIMGNWEQTIIRAVCAYL